MPSDNQKHWQKTRNLTFIVLGIWAFVAFGVNWIGEGLNSATFPGAYFMAGQGSQIIFAILVFWFAYRQNKIDEQFGVEEQRSKKVGADND